MQLIDSRNAACLYEIYFSAKKSHELKISCEPQKGICKVKIRLGS